MMATVRNDKSSVLETYRYRVSSYNNDLSFITCTWLCHCTQSWLTSIRPYAMKNKQLDQHAQLQLILPLYYAEINAKCVPWTMGGFIFLVIHELTCPWEVRMKFWYSSQYILIINTVFLDTMIPFVKIKLSEGHLIFIMGITILVK